MKKLLVVTFIIYSVALVNLVLFKGPLFYQVVSPSKEYVTKTRNASYSRYNLVPFRTIKNFLNPHPSTAPSARFFNLVGNIALFVPFGFFFPALLRRNSGFGQTFLATFLLSLLFELIQLITQTGQFDVDDLILNSLGGVIGFGIFLLLKNWLLKKQMETRS